MLTLKNFGRRRDYKFVADYLEFGSNSRMASILAYTQALNRHEKNLRMRKLYTVLVWEQVFLLLETCLAVAFAFKRRKKYTFLKSLTEYQFNKGKPDLTKPPSRLFSKGKYVEETLRAIGEDDPETVNDFRQGAEDMLSTLRAVRKIYRKGRISFNKLKHGFVAVERPRNFFDLPKRFPSPAVVEVSKSGVLYPRGIITLYKKSDWDDILQRSKNLIEWFVHPLLKVYLIELSRQGYGPPLRKKPKRNKLIDVEVSINFSPKERQVIEKIFQQQGLETPVSISLKRVHFFAKYLAREIKITLGFAIDSNQKSLRTSRELLKKLGSIVLKVYKTARVGDQKLHFVSFQIPTEKFGNIEAEIEQKEIRNINKAMKQILNFIQNSVQKTQAPIFILFSNQKWEQLFPVEDMRKRRELLRALYKAATEITNEGRKI